MTHDLLKCTLILKSHLDFDFLEVGVVDQKSGDRSPKSVTDILKKYTDISKKCSLDLEKSPRRSKENSLTSKKSHLILKTPTIVKKCLHYPKKISLDNQKKIPFLSQKVTPISFKNNLNKKAPLNHKT